MKKILKYPLLLLFAGFLLLSGIADLIMPDREFSVMENRYLDTRPKLSWSSLIDTNADKKFSTKYERYINDQFIGRDSWITLKSVSESALGKIENNGIIYGKDNHLFDKYLTEDGWQIDKNIGFINKFVNRYSDQANITIAIVPNSYEVYRDLLPEGLHNIDQKERIQTLYDQWPESLAKLDLLPVMSAEKDGYIYYRTDHHWTAKGAYLGYRAFVESVGRKAVELEALSPFQQTYPGFYGAYYNKCKLFSAKADVIDAYEVPLTSMTIDGAQKPALNDPEKWEGHDKYAAFLWGNNGVTILKSDNNLNREPGKTSRVLVIKDSYGNCFAPFLTYSYDEVYITDPRYVPKYSVLLEEMEFDDILILYNYKSFVSDTNIAHMTY